MLTMGTSIAGIGAVVCTLMINALEPRDFQDRVQEAGGEVGFVFDQRPTPSCHASTVTALPNGDLLCAWFAGTEESASDVAIWLSRHEDGRWSRPEMLAKVEISAHWNPVLFTDGDGVVHLFFKVGPHIPYWRTYWMSSQDGREWSAPQPLVDGDAGGRGPVRCKPIVLHDGAWLAGASTEYDGWRPFADRSEDGGQTWERSDYWPLDPAITGRGAIQPTLWESEPEQVHALLRTTAGFIGRADSADGGRTWSSVELTSLPNPSAGIDVAVLADGALLLVYNPVPVGRSPLTLARSIDNGATWKDIAHLETGPDGEYSYPAIMATEEGVVISYTWQRWHIKTWIIPRDALLN